MNLPASIKSIRKYYYTIRYLKFSQTFGRMYAVLKKKSQLIGMPEIPGDLHAGKLPNRCGFIFHEPWNKRANIVGGKFVFLNKAIITGFPRVKWEPENAGLLWKYNLHYFNYLFLLENNEQTEICRAWIKHNPPGKGTGWHPYPLSLRIVNWCKSEPEEKDILESLYYQAGYLYRNTEFYHPANHYLENAIALIFAAVLFDGAGESGKWLDKGMSILKKQIPLQVLKDGAYFELTPMYHSIILNGLLDVLNISGKNGKINDNGVNEILTNTCAAMQDYLYSVVSESGCIPLFNDSSEEIAPPSESIIAYSQMLVNKKANRKSEFPEAGHYIFRNGMMFMVIDGGPPGPDNIPAHAHADIFSYELEAYGHKIIVDSGVYEYQSGPMRDYFRSTKAHNTLNADGTDQAECWGSFRVARRYKPRQVNFSENGGDGKFSGIFDGYSSLIGDSIQHKREIEFSSLNRTVVVADTLSGKGMHAAESRIHLHPSVKAEINDGIIRLSVRDVSVEISVSECEKQIIKGWYSPRFGVIEACDVIVFSVKKDLPSSIIYKIKVN